MPGSEGTVAGGVFVKSCEMVSGPRKSLSQIGNEESRKCFSYLHLRPSVSARATGLEPATSGSTVPFLRVVKPEPESKLRQSIDIGRSAGRSDDESEGCNDNPDLSRLVAAWPTLSEPVRRAMLAILEAAT